MEIIRVLIGNHYQIYSHSNGINYLKFFWINKIVPDLHPDMVYDMTKLLVFCNRFY